MTAMRLVVVGAGGRMGKTLAGLLAGRSDAVLHAVVERPGAPALGTEAAPGISVTDDLDAALAGAEGILDFTAPAASIAFAQAAARRGLVHVIGTTGFSPEDETALRAVSSGARIVKSGNMSLGVNLLAGLVQQAARALGPAAFDIEILEMHHRHKVDAPSGTALLLGEAAAKGRGVDLEAASVRVRDGITGAREAGTIGFATLRGGSVIGEHSVILAGEGERIELSHQAADRSVFGRGAITAALWARQKAPGHYSMRDVLGLSS